MKLTRTTAISGLFLGCRPSAIGGFVRPVVVTAIKSLAIGPFAHVGKEVGEVVPPFAHGDTATTVILPTAALGVAATSEHRGPRRISASRWVVPVAIQSALAGLREQMLSVGLVVRPAVGASVLSMAFINLTPRQPFIALPVGMLRAAIRQAIASSADRTATCSPACRTGVIALRHVRSIPHGAA